MNDFDWEVRQKKKIARNARYQKKGSKSKRCTLPSDYLTEPQKRKLNGECMTYQINKPITWAEFKAYPRDIQKKYMEHFASEHGCTASMLEKMFGCKKNVFHNYIYDNPELKGIMSKSTNADTKMRFVAWCDAERGVAAEHVQSEVETPTETPKEVKQEPLKERPVFTFNNCVKSGRISVDGTPNEIGVALVNIFHSQRIKATISFEVVE